MKSGESRQNLLENASAPGIEDVTISMGGTKINVHDLAEKPLGPIEKKFLLHVERGDCATVRSLIRQYGQNPQELDINCVDPLNRSALIAAIENENIELIRLLLEEKIKVKDGLLHAIKEEYVEAVELLLQYEEDNHLPGEPYSWEVVDRSSATFTSDITPLILAAHKNNYEIIKILLDRGASLPMPHDVRCGCDDCVASVQQDSLRHSLARINAYRALSSSSLIALSSKDPLLTAFELSWELRRLSRMETEFRAEYNDMRSMVQTFATCLLDHARTSYEVEIMLNYDADGDTWEPGEHQSLERLKLAINYKQKMFVAHPSVQQLLASIWYEGLPGFRRKSAIGQLIQVAHLGTMFPVYCTIYMLAPESKMGKFMKKPFVKFICHSSSYALFLTLLGMASQRVEIVFLEWFGTEWMRQMVEEWKRKERGAGPGIAECGVILYMISLIWEEIRALWTSGLTEYLSDLWNIVDFITNMFYVTWLAMRISSFYIVWKEASEGRDPWYPREQWHSFDPMLLSEGAFAAGMIFSFLKLVHIFSVNPHLGPLQISLGRMIIDIVKFFFIYTLVLFAFGCGLNQLLWYYAELEKSKCYHLPSGLPDFDNNDKACSIWRRYANLFETSQSLFWASFGLVDLVSFELTGIKGFTRFWALLMFGSYSVINVIVLLNMLIAMMSNSYQIISERSDSEWKFARSKLWISYFDDGDTVPPPFNLFPTPKNILRTMGCNKKVGNQSVKRKRRETVRERHETVMRLLVRRYVTSEQRKSDFGITEDDVMEIRQDISTLRYELIDILRNNGMKTPKISYDDTQVTGKKSQVMERYLMKDFHIGIVEAAVSEAVISSKEPKDIFGQLAKAIGKRSSTRSKKKDWNALVRRNTVIGDPIGSSEEAENARMVRQSLRRHILANITKPVEIDQDKLLEYNPRLSEVPKGARMAYAKFMTKKIQQDYSEADETESRSLKGKSIKRQAPRPSVKFEGAEPTANVTSARSEDSKIIEEVTTTVTGKEETSKHKLLENDDIEIKTSVDKQEIKIHEQTRERQEIEVKILDIPSKKVSPMKDSLILKKDTKMKLSPKQTGANNVEIKLSPKHDSEVKDADVCIKLSPTKAKVEDSTKKIGGKVKDESMLREDALKKDETLSPLKNADVDVKLSPTKANIETPSKKINDEKDQNERKSKGDVIEAKTEKKSFSKKQAPGVPRIDTITKEQEDTNGILKGVDVSSSIITKSIGVDAKETLKVSSGKDEINVQLSPSKSGDSSLLKGKSKLSGQIRTGWI